MRSLTMIEAFELLMRFYEQHRAIDAAPIDHDGDMLLFQYGTYDWGNGERFSISLTRQLIVPHSEDSDIWQLELSFSYLPNETLRSFQNGDKWCGNPDQLDAYRSSVLNSPVFIACSSDRAETVNLTWEHV